MEFVLAILTCIDILLGLWRDYNEFKKPKPLTSLEHFLFMYDFKEQLMEMMSEKITEEEEKIKKAKELEEFYKKMKGENDK